MQIENNRDKVECKLKITMTNLTNTKMYELSRLNLKIIKVKLTMTLKCRDQQNGILAKNFQMIISHFKTSNNQVEKIMHIHNPF